MAKNQDKMSKEKIELERKISQFKEAINKLGSKEAINKLKFKESVNQLGLEEVIKNLGSENNYIEKEIETLKNEIEKFSSDVNGQNTKFIHSGMSAPTLLVTAIQKFADKINYENDQDPYFEFIKFLIDKENCINEKDRNQKTPLEYALEINDKRLFKKLFIEYNNKIELNKEKESTHILNFMKREEILSKDNTLSSFIKNKISAREKINTQTKLDHRTSSPSHSLKDSENKKSIASVKEIDESKKISTYENPGKETESDVSNRSSIVSDLLSSNKPDYKTNGAEQKDTKQEKLGIWEKFATWVSTFFKNIFYKSAPTRDESSLSFEKFCASRKDNLSESPINDKTMSKDGKTVNKDNEMVQPLSPQSNRHSNSKENSRNMSNLSNP